jgi:membrane-associated phospholipid phosphatase
MLDSLLQWDQALFQLINSQGQHAFFDVLLPFWRTKSNWIPLYIFVLGLLFWKYDWRKVLFFLLLIGLAVLLADQISSQWIKKSVMRIRPCNDADLMDEVRLLVKCGSGYSFTSSHATNHFALAFLFIQMLLPKFPKIRWVLVFSFLLWATLVAYAQVYVGVHYPLDVLAGALLGTLIGAALWWLAKRLIKTLFKS